MRFSIIIVTHNPRRPLLRRVCAAIAGQIVDPSTYELIIVDNASTPALTVADAGTIGRPVTVLREDRLGIMHARIAGIRAASAEAIVFVDDDNVLAPDYLKNAAVVLDSTPAIGAVGGIVEGEFEVPVPAWAQDLTHLLAIRNFGAERVVSQWRAATPQDYPWCAPFGAGMVVRTRCARRYVDHVTSGSAVSIGRIGTHSLGGCDDAELIVEGVLKEGFEAAYDPALRLLHCIPPRRLTFRYLSRLAYQSGITWGAFRVRQSYSPRIPRWSVLPRCVRSFVNERAWTRGGFVTWRSRAGEFVGRALVPPAQQHRERQMDANRAHIV